MEVARMELDLPPFPGSDLPDFICASRKLEMGQLCGWQFGLESVRLQSPVRSFCCNATSATSLERRRDGACSRGVSMFPEQLYSSALRKPDAWTPPLYSLLSTRLSLCCSRA